MWEIVGEFPNMFRGLTAIQIDAKGRLSIPSRYRAALVNETAQTVVVTIDTEQPCLLLYPTSRWLEIEEQVERLSSLHPPSRRIQRLLIGHATDVELDNQGRILLPPLLREYARLEKSAILVGQGKKLEIWNDAQWQAARASWLAEATNGLSAMSSELLSLSL
jgi:transcriptional regulator MraZ